jgi:hypothetical protein
MEIKDCPRGIPAALIPVTLHPLEASAVDLPPLKPPRLTKLKNLFERLREDRRDPKRDFERR